MSKLFIEDTTLTAIADAIRSKTGSSVVYMDYMEIPVASKTYGVIEYDYNHYTFPNAASIKVVYSGVLTYPSSGAGKFGIVEGTITSGGYDATTAISIGTTYSFTGDTFTVFGKGQVTIGGTFKVTGYDADGNIIQYAVESEGENTTQYTPLEMPAAILSISGEGSSGITPSGELEIIENGSYDVTEYASAQVSVPVGVFPEGTLPITENGEYEVESYASVLVDVVASGGSELEEVVLTGNCDYACAGGLANAVIPQMADKISTTNIYQAPYMFYNSNLEEIPFEINFYANYDMSEVNNMFHSATNLKTFPTINNLNPKNATQMFCSCSNLTDIPEGATSTWSFNKWHSSTAAQAQHVFRDCHKLRHIDSNLLKNLWNINTLYLYNMYYYLFQYCYSLDEVRNLGVSTATLTSNAFNNTFNYCSHLKNFTFVSGKSAAWNNQVIDLTIVGYFTSTGNRSDDFTDDVRVTDLASYEALNSNSAWWTTDLTFSRYNHDSAVTTINSLPTISTSGATNTIKFRGDMGSGYGKAISDLTEDEIAVATAKGWTVTIV